MTPAALQLSAGLVLIRDGSQGLEVLMVTRSPHARFAAGALVFPGGRLEDADHARSRHGRNIAGIDSTSLLFRTAAIREAFEECGILLARHVGDSDLADVHTAERYVDGHHDREAFDQLLSSGEIVLATDALIPFSHWVTPASQPLRYDAHFFLAQAPANQVALHDGVEVMTSHWLTPQEAIRLDDAGTLNLLYVTRQDLRRLMRSQTVAEALQAARQEAVAPIEPEIRSSELGLDVIMPDDPRYR